MNKTLFQEAVADAHKLRELAEDTAKNRVIEAVMPQIRDLVNKRILGEMDGLEELESLPDTLEDELVMPDSHSDDTGANASVTISPGAPVDVEVSTDGSVSVSTDGVKLNISADEAISTEPDDVLVLDQPMAEALSKLISGELGSAEEGLSDKIDSLQEKVKRLSLINETVNSADLTAAQKKRIQLSLLYCVREAIKLRTEVILTECTTQERLERRLTRTIKEIRTMSKSNRRNIFDFLFEQEAEKKGELEEAELSLELTDDEQEELAGADDPESVGDTLDTILSDLEVSLDAGEEAEEPAEGEEAEEGAEEEVADMEMDADLEEVYEIDETMLRRELRKMNEQEEADPMADQFGGGDVEFEVMEVDEDDLLNALADELGDVAQPDAGPAPSPTEAMGESRRRRAARRRRSISERRRTSSHSSKALFEARKELASYKKAVRGLKGQLVEMNLFNAKLLYANKLMQNKNLTMKQQKAIVEALDNAKTLREAKLLFKSLSESLTRRSRSNRLSEGSLRTIGSSSRSTRSASPAKSGAEVDRWAVLAGIYDSND